MSSDNNIVEFKIRQKKKTDDETAPHEAAPVIDMTERRQEIIMEERRSARRTVLDSFIGAFCIVPKKGLLKVALYDISEDGLAFDMKSLEGQFPLNEEVAMRVYLSRDTYFPFVVKIQNVRVIEGEDVYRHGANFVKGSISDAALFHFVKFIENVSASLHRDAGDHVAGGGFSR